MTACCDGAVAVAAGAVPSYLPISDPSILTVTDAGFRSPPSSVRPSIARGAITDITSVQNGVYRFAFVVPTRRFLAQFSKGVSSPPPFAVGGEERGENHLPILLASSDGAEEPTTLNCRRSKCF